MTIVVDASVAVKWVIEESDSGAADALLDQDLMAPTLWLAETANALWRKTRIGDITAEEASDRLSELQKAPVALVAIEPYLAEALKLAMELGHAVYDCIYLALAIAHDTHVVTADRRFAAAASLPGLAGRVRLLVS